MTLFALSEVIEEAIQTEKLGYQFYTSMAQKFKDNGDLRDLFNTLAGKELGHEKKFLEMRDKAHMADMVDWQEVSKYLRAIVESEFFLGKGKSLPSLDSVRTADEAVRYALSFEKETLLYFHVLRDAVMEKNAVDEIIAEERSHIVWLSNFRSAGK